MLPAKQTRKKKKPRGRCSRFLRWLKSLFLPPEKKVRGKRKPKPPCDLGDEYYTTKEVAEALQVSVSALCGYRRKGIGPKYTAVSYRNYRYPKLEMMQYLKEQTRASTSATRNYDYNPNKQKGD